MDQIKSDVEAGEAARWYARLCADDCTAADRQAFKAWLAESPGHGRAYGRAKLLAGRVQQLAKSDPRLRALAAEALRGGAPPPGQFAQRWRMAASLLLGVGIAAMLVLQLGFGQWPRPAAVAHFLNTGISQQLVALSDGSRVHLDVGAKLDVQFGKTQRMLVLQKGRAYFEVAHDASRPFSVEARGVSTVALGTRFQVALVPEGVDVTLAEGSVVVSKAGPRGWKEVLRPGQQLQFSVASGDRTRHDIDTSVVLGWPYGRLVFRDTRLAAALDEINRYAEIKLRLGEEGIGDVPIGGTFVAGADRVRVAAALAAALPLNAVQVGASEIVLFRRHDSVD